VAAIIPYRPDSAERVANWQRTRQQWETLSWPCYPGDHNGESFSRARAINATVQALDVDVLCIADVDILFSDPQVAVEAAQMALEQCAHVVPYSTMRVLDEVSSKRVRAGEDPGEVPILESIETTWVSACVISRELFDRVKGFDERFVGYGEEDLGFVASTGTMGQKLRVNGTAYHLSHGEPAKDHPLRQQNRDLCSRYRGADGDKEAMQLILDER
jgi:hypothetical protein